MDWTLQKYEALCAALITAGYVGLGMSDYMKQPDRSEKIVLLRHDVDSRPAHSLQLGQIEKKYGLTATYFYRTVNFDPAVLQKMHTMGHEVGYHYETLAQANGRMPKALALLESELAKLRQYVPVTAASMHGSPLRPWDNRAVWQHIRPEQLGLCGEVYLSIDYAKLAYLSDTGRTWHPTRYNIRDHTDTPPPYQVETTDELIELILTGQIHHLCLLTHPERWQSGRLAWQLQQIRDTSTNGLKIILKRLYTVRWKK
ncbi:MAG: hypothetical protein K8I82_28020 [Anaerolineae bacterium]|nr:hypothetical protein [Anaerolineae bacterium]